MTIDIAQIYTDDLFGTYEVEQPTEEKPEERTIPEPPPPVAPKKHFHKEPVFLDPLPITLKGIIVLPNDDSKNRAIILDNETKTQKTYQVGDTIKDAQLRKIMSNKIVVIRANGQQEILYLREKDAQDDPLYELTAGWDKIFVKISDFDYLIHTKPFVEKIKNIGEFIDMLDLTSVFKEGKNIGLRLGTPGSNSLMNALGMQVGDIVYQVADITITDNTKQYEAYKKVKNLASEQSFEVKLVRKNQPMVLRYTVKFSKQEEKEPLSRKIPTQQLTQEEVRKEKKKLLEQKHKFAPTIREIHLREKMNMQNNGQKESK